MLSHELLGDEGILIVSPRQSLESADFESVSQAVDPYIEQHGPLAGLLIDAESFPGWQNFGALLSHFRFVRDHHRNIRKVAAVTDDKLLSFLPAVASHFVAADVKHFPYADKQAALEWLRSG